MRLNEISRRDVIKGIGAATASSTITSKLFKNPGNPDTGTFTLLNKDGGYSGLGSDTMDWVHMQFKDKAAAKKFLRIVSRTKYDWEYSDVQNELTMVAITDDDLNNISSLDDLASLEDKFAWFEEDWAPRRELDPYTGEPIEDEDDEDDYGDEDDEDEYSVTNKFYRPYTDDHPGWSDARERKWGMHAKARRAKIKKFMDKHFKNDSPYEAWKKLQKMNTNMERNEFSKAIGLDLDYPGNISPKGYEALLKKMQWPKKPVPSFLKLYQMIMKQVSGEDDLQELDFEDMLPHVKYRMWKHIDGDEYGYGDMSQAEFESKFKQIEHTPEVPMEPIKDKEKTKVESMRSLLNSLDE